MPRALLPFRGHGRATSFGATHSRARPSALPADPRSSLSVRTAMLARNLFSLLLPPILGMRPQKEVNASHSWGPQGRGHFFGALFDALPQEPVVPRLPAC
eukprot:14570-Alexandrium_andersonii.AAC.1